MAEGENTVLQRGRYGPLSFRLWGLMAESEFKISHLYITLVLEGYGKRNMDYSNFTGSELFTLTIDQKAALLHMTTGPTHPSEEKIKETQADLDNMVTAMNSAFITTLSIAQKNAHNYDLAMRQQSLRDAIKQKNLYWK